MRLPPGGRWSGRIIWLKPGARSGVCGCCGVFGNMPGIGAALKGGIDFEALRRNTEAWARRGYRLVYKRFKERIPKLKRTQASARYSHLFWCGCRAVYTNLLCREFTAEAPNRKWATDVTEFAVDGQKLYLSPIIDLYNGEVVSYAMARNPRFELVTRMLDKAFTRIKGATDLMLHSDQGWQYQMAQYRKRLQMKGICSARGTVWTTQWPRIFSPYSSPSCSTPRNFSSVEQPEKAIHQYIDYYNNDRIKLKLKGLSSVKYRTQSSNSA